MQPAYHVRVVSKARRADRTDSEISVSWNADASSPPLRGVVAKVRSRAPIPRGSAYLPCWQGRTRPSPSVLSEVSSSCHFRPATCSSTCCALSRSAPENSTGDGGTDRSPKAGVCDGEVANGSRSRLALTPSRSVTRVPDRTTAAAAAATPISVWVRRRAAPARRMMVGRGQLAASTGPRSASISDRMLVVGTLRWTANWAVASWSFFSASARDMPASRAISPMLSEARWVSSRVFRCASGSFPRASRVARASGSRVLSRCQIRAVWRRWAWDQAYGRTDASGSSCRETLRQWCQATMKASRTALRAAGRSPVSA